MVDVHLRQSQRRIEGEVERDVDRASLTPVRPLVPAFAGRVPGFTIPVCQAPLLVGLLADPREAIAGLVELVFQLRHRGEDRVGRIHPRDQAVTRILLVALFHIFVGNLEHGINPALEGGGGTRIRTEDLPLIWR